MKKTVIPALPPESEANQHSARLQEVVARYPVRMTPQMAARMAAGDPADPLVRQFLPRLEELQTLPDETDDPISDAAYSPVAGIVHRYPDRVLVLPTWKCAVHCRFCFRRTRVGKPAPRLGAEEQDAALAYIRQHHAVREVILTGGDPLMLGLSPLRVWLEALDAIPHVRVLRLHSRVPVVAPERITPGLIRCLRKLETPVYLAVHANHPREFTAPAGEALRRLAQAGVGLLGQSVLLRGVNADADTLAALMQAFLAHRIRPYYLHHLDPAPGTGHFRVSLAEGQALVQGLRGRLSGLAQPVYVLDIPGGHGKSPLDPGWVSAEGTQIRDWRGQLHPLPRGLAAAEPENPSLADSLAESGDSGGTRIEAEDQR